MALAEAEDPHWSSCAWTLFWRAELPALSDFGAAAPLEDMIGWREFPSSFNPFSLLPEPGCLTPQETSRLAMWIEGAGEWGADNPVLMRHFGRYLALAPDDWPPILDAGYGEMTFFGAYGLAELAPSNISARVLALSHPACLAPTTPTTARSSAPQGNPQLLIFYSPSRTLPRATRED